MREVTIATGPITPSATLGWTAIITLIALSCFLLYVDWNCWGPAPPPPRVHREQPNAFEKAQYKKWVKTHGDYPMEIPDPINNPRVHIMRRNGKNIKLIMPEQAERRSKNTEKAGRR